MSSIVTLDDVRDFERNFNEGRFFNELYRAFVQARRAKTSTRDEHELELHALENLYQLREDILTRDYEPSRGIAFIVFDPVIREIFAAPFRDRVVHHFLFNMVNDWWDRHIIFDSYSCRVGKGTHFGVKRLARFMNLAAREVGKDKVWVIKLDVQGYFMSMPRAGLYERICWGLDQQFPKKGQLYEICKFLWHKVIFDDPTKDVIRRGKPSDWAKLPRSKSLFCQPEGKGIVIGNLSSQLLSNIYLDALDRFIKFQLGYKYYGRYVDDFFMIVTEDELPQALQDIYAIEEFLRELDLTLHPQKRYIQPVSKGVPFLGARVYPGRIVADRRIVNNFLWAAQRFGHFDVDEGVILSYLGHMKHVNGKRTCQKIFDQVGWDWIY